MDLPASEDARFPALGKLMRRPGARAPRVAQEGESSECPTLSQKVSKGWATRLRMTLWWCWKFRALFSCCRRDFDMTRTHKFGDYHSCPGRTGFAEERSVNSIHPLEGCAIGEVHLHADYVRW